MIAWSPLIGAWLAGLLGGAHCLAMCGGFVAAMAGASSPSRAVPLQPARALAWAQLPYNLGRITTYTVLGAAAGGMGGAVLGTSDWLPVQRTLYVIANLALLALAWVIVTRREGLLWLQLAGSRLFVRLRPVMKPLLHRAGVAPRFALGTLWGFVPCAMTYSVLPVALFAGGWWQGALVMAAFGLGTLPNLMAAGWFVATGRRWLDRAAIRVGAALLLGGFAAVGIWRALGDPSLLAQGPFCLVH